MCTAVSVNFKHFYFGRTLDLDYSFGQRVVILPRRFKLNFKCKESLVFHYAIMGMAAVKENFPLFFDAMNEKGLCFAGLRFQNNAYYGKILENRTNLAPFELPLWILSLASSVTEAKNLLRDINIVDIPFSDELLNTHLHWIFADKTGALTVEPTKEGLSVFDNQLGVLANNPPFETMLESFKSYEFDSSRLKNPLFPGDFSSKSRFARAVFVKENSYKPKTEQESLAQFFHIMNSVNVPKGCVILENGKPHFTQYTSCIDTKKGVYYYKNYENPKTHKIDMNSCNLDGDKIFSF